MKVVRTGHFFKGRMVGGWEFEGNWKEWVEMKEDGRVMVNGVEIVPWTEARKKSMDGKGWVEV